MLEPGTQVAIRSDVTGAVTNQYAGKRGLVRCMVYNMYSVRFEGLSTWVFYPHELEPYSVQLELDF